MSFEDYIFLINSCLCSSMLFITAASAAAAVAATDARRCSLSYPAFARGVVYFLFETIFII